MNSNPDIPDLIKMHYHQYPQDLFQGLLPSQQFGVVSTIRTNVMGNSTLPSRSSNNVPLYGAGNSTESLRVSDSGGTSGGVLNVEFDVVALRSAIALQKWKEYNGRAGWKAGEQQRAMFGVGEASDRVHDVEYIDSYQFPIMIDEVTQSSCFN